jgi:Fe-S oxidoreductase
MATVTTAEFVKKCYQCGMCSGFCPKARVKSGFLPRRIVYDTITGQSSRVVQSGDTWDCLTCGLCQIKCPMKVGFLDMIRESRKAGMNGACKIAHDNTLSSSLYNIMKSRKIVPKRKQFLGKDVKISEDSDVLYFMGCTTYLDIIFKDDVGFEGMEIANSTIKLLNAVGIEPAVLDREKCCGHDQLWRGQIKDFEDFGRQNAELLKKYKTIIVSCPECLRTLAIDYKEKLDVELNVKHISEFLLENADKLKTNGNKVAVTFHDSCRLGRYMNVYEAPRELLKLAGYELREMVKNRDEALCCGISAFVNCDDENKELRRRKMKDALETGADIMVTPCPKCQIHLKCLQKDESEPEYNIKIADLSTVLMENLKR